MLSLSKQERTLQAVKYSFQPCFFLRIVFQSLPFDRLPSTGSGQAGRTD
ncbi:MAG: hypothetical protein LBD67_00435 [Candidatus Accumulibacter sp.]|nr:hypothetical protein [Accumulibacter sp.]